MTVPPNHRHRRRVLAAGLLAALTLTAVPAVAADDSGSSAPTASSTGSGASGSGAELPTGVLTVDGQDVPVLASFVYHEFNKDTNPEIRGLIHGVQRIDGGTVVYYSLGTPTGSAFRGSQAFPNSSAPYQLGHGTDLRLIDSAGLVGYRPLYDGETTFASETSALDGDTGDLRVGWAVFPELGADVEDVQVVMPWGTAVADIPVADGALEPEADEAGPLLGEGWPAVPSGDDLAGADPAQVTYDLTRRSGDAAGTAQVAESPEEVAVTLDANVLFASGSADLSAEAQATLATVAQDIAARATGEVVVTGHTDSDGSDTFNQTLSEQRAAAVQAVLAPASGNAVTFSSVGRGETEPVAPNDTDEGKQANRRVTVVYSVQEGQQ
ncbi:OmpA family protein [Cellulomonas sp. RIT-PI-Y]|uniref:OmpA family protein n=1 Tax=Cellulomonas sp. RIT-PI-Y TaxID=3035297 RepID=UPI0021DA69F6|nr:OmpA family protein [Cellulomonas sp. RIT-PI-Y]